MTAPDISNRKWRKIRKLVLARDPFCVYCGAIATTVDHVHPTKHGGQSTLDNLVGACARCNYSKGARPRPTGHRGGLRANSRTSSILSSQEATASPKGAISLPASSDRSPAWKLSPKGSKNGN